MMDDRERWPVGMEERVHFAFQSLAQLSFFFSPDGQLFRVYPLCSGHLDVSDVIIHSLRM